MLVILYIVGYDRRRPDRHWLSKAPLDRSLNIITMPQRHREIAMTGLTQYNSINIVTMPQRHREIAMTGLTQYNPINIINTIITINIVNISNIVNT